jgi:hypothetical protein
LSALLITGNFIIDMLLVTHTDNCSNDTDTGKSWKALVKKYNYNLQHPCPGWQEFLRVVKSLYYGPFHGSDNLHCRLCEEFRDVNVERKPFGILKHTAIQIGQQHRSSFDTQHISSLYLRTANMPPINHHVISVATANGLKDLDSVAKYHQLVDQFYQGATAAAVTAATAGNPATQQHTAKEMRDLFWNMGDLAESRALSARYQQCREPRLWSGRLVGSVANRIVSRDLSWSVT